TWSIIGCRTFRPGMRPKSRSGVHSSSTLVQAYRRHAGIAPPAGPLPALGSLSSQAQKVRKNPIRARNSFRQLAIEGNTLVNVSPLAVRRKKQPALLRLLVRIVHLEQRHVTRIPARHEPVPALFDPALEIGRGDAVGLAEHRVVGLEDLHGRV